MNQSRASLSHFASTKTQITINEVDRLQEQLDELRSKIVGDVKLNPSTDINSTRAKTVRHVLRARRRRDEILGPELFGEPAWDILLEVYFSELTYQKMSISDACMASAVPQTTALRWVSTLYKQGWLARRDDPLDGRRVWLSLTPRALQAMDSYVEALQRAL